MKRNVIAFLIILAAVIGPAIYAQKISGSKQTVELPASSKTDSSLKGGQLSGGEQTPSVERANKDEEQKTAGDTLNQGTGPQAKNDLTNPSTPGQKKSSSGNDGQGRAATIQKPVGRLPGESKESGYLVGIAVVGMNGELLYGPGNVTVTEKNVWGITALGALDATGLPYTMSTRWSNFIEAIAGQHNKGQAGWMYKVNEEIPLVAADQKPLKAGDKVIWWYSKSMNAPPPNWGELEKRK
ncbi:MAG: DUF4430 domain-containing protein [Bacillota bacterium]